MASIIVAAPSIPGETAPLLVIARALVQRGHAVKMIAGTQFADVVTATQAEFVPMYGSGDFTPELAAEYFRGREGLTPGPEQLNYDWIHGFIDPIADQYAILQELLSKQPESILVANSLFLGALPVALGAPGHRPTRWIAVSANPLVISSDDTTPMGPIPGITGAEARLAHRAANAGMTASVEPARLRLEEHVRALGGTAPVHPFMQTTLDTPDVFASLSVPEFDFPRSDDPPHLRYIGIVTPESDPSWIPPAWWSELDDDKPVIVVTQGTANNSDLRELVAPVLEAFADQDVHVVAALGRTVDDTGLDVPANARLAEFAPFADLLPKADLLITSGGFGGTQLALAEGIPVIVAGVTEDKPFTAARVAFHGVGANLNTSTPTSAQIREAYQEIIGSATLQSALDRLRDAYASHNTIDELEELMQSGPASPTV